MQKIDTHHMGEDSAQLTAGKAAILVAVSTGVWFGVANFIRLRAPQGDFDGAQGILTYAATIPITVFINWLTPRIVRLPARQTLPAVAVTLATAPTLEGIVMRCYPAVYGPDSAAMAKGAIWLLWAIGVALGLAVRTSMKEGRRLRAGDKAPGIRARNVVGGEVITPGENESMTHVQFLRFAKCPACNLHLQTYFERADELRRAGIKEVVFFHSQKNLLVELQEKFPFDVIADPEKTFFSAYRVESSPWAILSPLAWPTLLRGYMSRPGGMPDSSPFGLPAEFLIGPEGTILMSHYGTHSSDQWSVDDVLRLSSTAARECGALIKTTSETLNQETHSLCENQ